jgi:hypothetical protein
MPNYSYIFTCASSWFSSFFVSIDCINMRSHLLLRFPYLILYHDGWIHVHIPHFIYRYMYSWLLLSLTKKMWFGHCILPQHAITDYKLPRWFLFYFPILTLPLFCPCGHAYFHAYEHWWVLMFDKRISYWPMPTYASILNIDT